ncbi:MAG: nucleoside monophosphate kinase [Candidatus Aenigmarchaeota archaeon]|nr:nucleoside monophosphate kinase [Candidatus Aenigmarchaeota archaeon]
MIYRAILLFGPPYAGKGTACKNLELPQLFYAASGNIIRRILGEQREPFASQINGYVKNGRLVPDDEMCNIFKSEVQHLEQTGVYRPSEQLLFLDGIPRTFEQAKSLDDFLDVLEIFHFTNLPNSVLRGRAAKRVQDALNDGKQPRTDDNPVAIEQRIKDYYEMTFPTLDFYKAPLRCVDALLPENCVKSQIRTLAMNAIAQYLSELPVNF